jgi:aspartyl-tRNA(Asn)/glutamyl-tRNA(Gln) amidotransferase subunit C
MTLDPETIQKMAHLSRLNLSSEESAEMQDTLSKILGWMEKLNEVDTSGVEPLIHLSPAVNVFREDVAQPGLSPEISLSNAPTRDGSFFTVPKVKE